MQEMFLRVPYLVQNRGNRGNRGNQGFTDIGFLAPSPNNRGNSKGTFGEQKGNFSSRDGQSMNKDFSPELGLTQEELLETLLSLGLARKVKKKIGGRIYEVLAIDGKVLEGLRK